MTDFLTDLEQCLITLHNGGVILYPTDTVWALGCDATNEAAVQKLMNLKGKSEQKGLIIILGSEREVLQYVANPDMEVFNFLAQQSKPTTVIYQNGLGVAEHVLNAHGTIAIRLVNENFCRHLVKRFKKPIVSTSANYSGNPSPAHFFNINKDLLKKVDYTVQFRRNDTEVKQSSAIIKWNADGTATFLRK